MTTLLLVPAGETDLQVLMKNNGVEQRVTPADLRAFHESLLEDRDWTIDEGAAGLEEFGERHDIRPSVEECLVDSNGRIRLVPAKLKVILDRIGQVDAAVVFGTWRDREVAIRPEPVAVGPVLAGWIEARNRGDIVLARELALQRREPWDPARSDWPGGAQWVNLLQGRERLEGDDPVERPLSQKLVARLHVSLLRLQEDLKPDRVIIARTGGFPAVKELIVLVASLIFGSERVEVLEVPQHSNKVVTYRANTSKSPQEAYRLREAALARIRAGDLEGAAAFAARAREDEWERPWAEAVIAAADWLAGRSVVPTSAPRYLTRLNVPFRCFWAAARAEAALRSGRIQEAIVSSVTFFDAALLDAIQQLDWVKSVSELEHTVEIRPEHSPPDSLTSGPEPTLTLCPRRPRVYWFKQQGPHLGRWLDVMAQPIKEALAAMDQALRTGNPAIKEYRNVAVHGRLVGNDLRQAEREFKAARVWPNGQPPRFLYNCGPALGVLRALGKPEAAAIIEDMLTGLEKEILLPPGGGNLST